MPSFNARNIGCCFVMKWIMHRGAFCTNFGQGNQIWSIRNDRILWCQLLLQIKQSLFMCLYCYMYKYSMFAILQRLYFKVIGGTLTFGVKWWFNVYLKPQNWKKVSKDNRTDIMFWQQNFYLFLQDVIGHKYKVQSLIAWTIRLHLWLFVKFAQELWKN